MSSSMNFPSDIILTRINIHPSPTRTSRHTTHFSKTSSTLIQYAPLSTSSRSILIGYAPLSLTTSISRSSSDQATISSHSSISSTHFPSPAITNHATISRAPISLEPSSSRSAEPGLQPIDPATGLTVIVSILMALLLAMATVMWLAEIKDRQTSSKTECQSDKIIGKTRKDAELIGLGITLQPTAEEKKEIGCCERLKGWLPTNIERGKSVNTIERWTNSAVSRLRIDLSVNAEEGLLLPVQENERIGSEKNQVYIEVDLD